MPAVLPPKRLVSKQDCALALGVSRPALDRYIAAGLPIAQRPVGNHSSGYLIDLDKALKWYGALQQRRTIEKPPLEVRVYEAARREWWNLCQGIMSPENLSMMRSRCRTTSELIDSAKRLSRHAGRELEALVERMEADSG